MTDVWANLSTADRVTVDRLAETLELRANESQQRTMLEEYLTHIVFGEAARVLEVECGTGAIARVLARWPGVGEAVGVDPSPDFVDRAQQFGRDIQNLTFEVADGRELPFPDQYFDVVAFHTTLCHLPNPERAIDEAHRVLRTGGCLSVFDGDYTTITVALSDHDPLQACVDAVITTGLENRWLVRRLPALVHSAGFEVRRFHSHGYLQTEDPVYMQNLVERGADLLHGSGTIGAELCEALKVESRASALAGRFFGFIAYASVAAVKR
jgi:ubiquinone/menaquinone biosynthesis C-methylase UbiE